MQCNIHSGIYFWIIFPSGRHLYSSNFIQWYLLSKEIEYLETIEDKANE